MSIPINCLRCRAPLKHEKMDGPARDFCPSCWDTKTKKMRQIASDALHCLNGLASQIDLMATGGWSADQIARKLDRGLTFGMSVTPRLVEVLANQRGIAFHQR